MIRINLLPGRRKDLRAMPGANVRAWGAVYVVGALLWVFVLVGVYFSYASDLDKHRQANSALETQIAQVRTTSARLDEVRAQLERSRRLEQVVDELNKARTGPARLLMQLSKILSPPPRGGPTIDPAVLEQLRRDNPLAGYNRTWDTRRLWLTSFEETDGDCRMVGVGRTNEDVAEFLHRLALSELFTEVRLEKTQSKTDETTRLSLIEFELVSQVAY